MKQHADTMTNWSAHGPDVLEPFTPEELSRVAGCIELAFAFARLAMLTRPASLKRWARS